MGHHTSGSCTIDFFVVIPREKVAAVNLVVIEQNLLDTNLFRLFSLINVRQDAQPC